MATTRWADMPHKISPQRRAEIKQAALAESQRVEQALGAEQIAEAADAGEDISSHFNNVLTVVRPPGS